MIQLMIIQLIAARKKKPIAPRIWKWTMLASIAKNEPRLTRKNERHQNHALVIRNKPKKAAQVTNNVLPM